MELAEANAKVERLEAAIRKLRRENVEMVAARLRAEGLLNYFRSQAVFLRDKQERDSRAAENGRKLLSDLEALVAATRLQDLESVVGTNLLSLIGSERLCCTGHNPYRHRVCLLQTTNHQRHIPGRNSI